ncbi:MANBA mannosidase, partial [Amia calva]|nr:MANBA mannosidase [Amia calva]
DPYYRFNDLVYRWIALDNWTYTRTFSLPLEFRQRQKMVLVCEGLDTVASVSINGAAVGNADNMFRRYNFDVSALLQESNVIEVRFVSAVAYAAQRSTAHASYKVPPDCPPPVQKGECHVNFIRKAQSSFSWDWGPSFPTQGIWRDLRVEAYDVCRLVYLSTTPSFDPVAGQWRIEAELFFDRGVAFEVFPESEECLVVLSLHFSLLPSHLRMYVSIFLKSVPVKLWWPNGQGKQTGYELSVAALPVRGRGTSVMDVSPGQVYFRTVELIQEPIAGSPGLSFYFRINGRSIKNLLQSAVDANMNTLRVWGGGLYEREEFYDICDELGIMIWQDFMFACALYPSESSFLNTVREEVTHQVRRLKSHPSIIVWSGNNENEAAIATDWFHIPPAEREVYRRDYVQLYINNIREIILREDSSRPFLSSSPTNGEESVQEGWIAENPYNPNYGDTHFYSYVDDCWNWKNFPRTRLASEYGFQSWPSFSTLQKVSAPKDWHYSSDFTAHRQHHLSGNKQMLFQAGLHFSLPVSTDPLQEYKDTLFLTQVMQAQCVKAQTEFYRRSRSEIIEGRGHTMGALYWQLNDIWQGPSWSSIEYGGKWKMLHYFAQDFFAPVLLVGCEDEEEFHIYAVSDLQSNLSATLQWSRMEAASTLLSPVEVRSASSLLVFKRPVQDMLGKGNCTRKSCFFTFALEAGREQHGPTNYHFLSSFKDAEGLEKPKLSATVEQQGETYVIILQTSAITPFVWLDAGDIPGRFEANGFHMLNKCRAVKFYPWRPSSREELARSLQVTSLTSLT